MPSAAELLRVYRETHYDVRLPGGTRVTLRIGRPPPPALADWVGSHWPMSCVSAGNPRSRKLPMLENRRRMRRLLAALGATDVRLLGGVGHVPGHAWREAFVLTAGLPISEVDRLAREFGQNAVVCSSDARTTRLRVYQTALCGARGGDDDLETVDD